MNRKRPPLVHESRTRLSKVRVLVADRDVRTASLVHKVLFSFGFQTIQLITRGDHALETLRKTPFDLIITEWNLSVGGGIELVKAIRQAQHDHVLKRDIPIIMLTAKADAQAVQTARDSGITEFLVKPFTAATLSHRLIQVIDNPRMFIDAAGYAGPDRRRREKLPDVGERRGAGDDAEMPLENCDTLPPNRDLQKKIGEDMRADEIFTEQLVATAQNDLQQQEGAFLDWAKEDVAQLEKAYAELRRHPESDEAFEHLKQAAYAIKSQAGIFGYHLGTEIAGNLVDYLAKTPVLKPESMMVLRKHIDTIAVILNQKIKDPTSGIGRDLLVSLQRLISKLG